MVFLWLVVLAGGSLHVVVSTGLLVLAVLAALMPDSSAPLFLVLGLAGRWWVAVPDPWSGWTLAAAVLLLAVHLASTLGSYGPPALAVPGEPAAHLGRAGGGDARGHGAGLAGRGPVHHAWPCPGTSRCSPSRSALVVGWIAVLGRRLVTRDGD